MSNAQYWIDRLKMKAHPEGGYYAETYRSPVLSGNRNLSTSIYFLLQSADISKFHALKSDELWYYHAGSTITIYEISPNGHLKETVLGIGTANETPSYLVKAGNIFGAEVNDDDAFTLISCVVSPGFDFQDFKLYGTKELAERFPEHLDIIKKLT